MQKIVTDVNFAEQLMAFSSQVPQKKTTDAVQIQSSNTVAKKMLSVAIPTATPVPQNVTTTQNSQPTASEPKKKNKSGSQKAKNKKKNIQDTTHVSTINKSVPKNESKTKVNKKNKVKEKPKKNKTPKKMKKNKKHLNFSFLSNFFDVGLNILTSPVFLGIIIMTFISVIFMSCI